MEISSSTLPAAAARANQPLVPVANGGIGAVTLSHCRWIRLYAVTTSSAPYDKARAGRGGAAECRGRTRVGFHRRGLRNDDNVGQRIEWGAHAQRGR